MRAVFLTSQRLITQHWPAAAQLLARVTPVVDREFTVEDLEELVREGRAVAGVALDAQDLPTMAMVFEFRHYPRKTILNVIALAGRDLERIAGTFWPSFVQWAKESGAVDIQACARPAMTRKLAKLGFSHTYNIVRMPTGAAS